MAERITIEDFRNFIQGSTGAIVDGFIPIFDGQFLAINSASGSFHGAFGGESMSFELWSADDMADYLGMPDSAAMTGPQGSVR